MAERFEFEAVVRVTEGRTRSPVVRFFDTESHQHTEMLVKSVGSALGSLSLCCEYFGNVIARQMGLNTPAPHIIEIDGATAAMMNRDSRLRDAEVTIPSGVAVGCEWLRPAVLPGTTARLSGAAAEDAARIYAHDLIMQQPDRTTTNPNVIEFRGRFVAIDFETSCSFLFAIVPDAAPWMVADLPYAQKHFFRSRLRPDTVDWREVVLSMLNIDTQAFTATLANLPAAWRSDCSRVLNHVERMNARSTDVIWQIISSVTRQLP